MHGIIMALDLFELWQSMIKIVQEAKIFTANNTTLSDWRLALHAPDLERY
jgi:hypothetical protein